MSTTDPDDLFTRLEAELGEQVVDDVEDVTALDTLDLMTNFHTVERELRTLQELHFPRTREGRDLHSKRAAYQLELRKRHLI